MPNNHILTRQIGNLRGFSTDSIYLRPPNVADKAINIQRAPDGSLQLRRGYQCQIGEIGGMGVGTFDDPAANEIKTVCVGTDGFVYNKLTKQIYFYYDGQLSGDIINVSNAAPANVNSVAHGLQTGAVVIIRDVGGLVSVNNQTYTITVVDPDNFTLDGSNTTADPAYISGGYWSVEFADMRYLTFSIITDPRYIYNNANQSITAQIIVNRAAQVNGNQTLTNTLTVQFGHELAATDVVQFNSSVGVFTQRNVVSVTPTTITIDGAVVSVNNGIYLNQFFDIPFGKGFDTAVPYSIASFINTITNVSTGIKGLQIAINGDDSLPAAFLQIVEPTVIDSNSEFQMDYWYWQRINFTANPPLPGSANITYQNSPDFENASMAAFDDVIYIANGWDYPQKYDGQTVYRTGMPEGIRPDNLENTTFISQPFFMGETYQYAITYEQIDNKGHIVEGVISEVQPVTIATATAAQDVIVTNLQSTPGSNWNTNGALPVGGASTVYGPDGNGFYYDLVPLNPGFTLKIGDSAYYGDLTAGVISAAVGPTITIPVLAGHAILAGDIVYLIDSSNNEIRRTVASVTATSFTIMGAPITTSIADATHTNVLVYKTSTVFGNVAIISGSQSNVNIINVDAGHTIQLNDIVSFTDAQNNIQRRTVTLVNATDITVSGIPVDVIDNRLIASENQRVDAVNFQRLNANAATLGAGTAGPISNNLRINIYRTQKNEIFGVNGKLFLVASIPNDSSGGVLQTYIDGVADSELGRDFTNPVNLPDPPPISKYLKAFGVQMFYAGGERGVSENSDRVFFSAGNNPEAVSLAADFFNVPNVDDDITGIGVSGSTLITTKTNSLWAATGNFLSGQIEVIQISPGTNIGCVAHATIASVGTLMYFVHTNGVYAITENQLFPTDPFGNPIPISLAIDAIFRETNYLPQTRYVFKRAVAVNYTKDNQYLLFVPCEDTQSTIRTANVNSRVFAYDYQGKNWFEWDNINAAGGMFVVEDNLYFQERRFSAVDGNTANLYKQHRFYRLVDHADHAGPQRIEWLASWEDLGQPEVRKKFARCALLMGRFSQLLQYNNPVMQFYSCLNRLPNLKSTIATVTQVDNIRNSSWSYSPWGWNTWAGYQDSFVLINLKQGTVAKSMQVGFTMTGINMDIKLAGYQLEAIPENRKSILR